MFVEILSRPANAAARVTLGGNERLTAEGGAMIAMSGDMNVETRIRRGEGKGGVFKGLMRKLGGEGLFMNHFTAAPGGGEIYLATALPGDMEVIELDGSTSLQVQYGSFVAHEAGIEMNISWGGLKNVFSGERMIWLDLKGRGKLIINAFGAVYPVEVDGEYIVDTGNIAAFENSLEYRITKAGRSLAGAVAGGEGFICRFKGKGTVWCQTHADKLFGAKLTPYLTPKEN